MNTFNDGYTQMLDAKINDWGLDRIYEIEENIENLEENEEEIIEYLKDIRCSMPIGLALRRYMCGKYSDIIVIDGVLHHKFVLSNGQTIFTSDYKRDNYDLKNDDVEAYVSVFFDVNSRYNRDKSLTFLSKNPKAEIRRLLRSSTYCLRSKIFLVSFALHMNNEETEKFLTDVLAEQIYNFRDPDEIIMFYCQRNEENNTYDDFCRIKNRFIEEVRNKEVEPLPTTTSYTQFARKTMSFEVHNEDELICFLLDNIQNFAGYSQTTYNEFIYLYEKVFKKTMRQNLSNDDYVVPEEISTLEQMKEQSIRISRARELVPVENTEQLAKEMLKFYPRASKKSKVNGKEVITGDFISITNEKCGQNNKKLQTTTLPKEITMNMLVSDRLDDLIAKRKPVLRKDLVFMKFYNFYLDMIDKGGEYLERDHLTFLDECNDMLVRCGMSKLYPANRFENLILLALFSSNPFEMFENIMEYSFINEPESIE